MLLQVILKNCACTGGSSFLYYIIIDRLIISALMNSSCYT